MKDNSLKLTTANWKHTFQVGLFLVFSAAFTEMLEFAKLVDFGQYQHYATIIINGLAVLTKEYLRSDR